MSGIYPYQITKVWLFELDENGIVQMNPIRIPIWIGNIIKHKLQCHQWFDTMTFSINSSHYQIFYDPNVNFPMRKIIISLVSNHCFIDLQTCPNLVADWVKTVIFLQENQ